MVKLDEKETIKTNSPIVSFENHRFAYVILNKKLNQPKKVTVLPFLHERKVYLNRLKYNTNYFYTTKQEEIRMPEDFE